VQVLKGLTAQELSADLMARCGLAFDQRDPPSLAGERDRSGTACHSTTKDENFVLHGNSIQCGRFNGMTSHTRPSITGGRELAPVEAEVHDQ
jgi:hypothetical protein